MDLTATLDTESAYADADFVVIATPTNYDSKACYPGASRVEKSAVLVMLYNTKAISIIKSTIQYD